MNISTYLKHSRNNRTSFASKRFILPHCLGSIPVPRSNERDPNSRAVKMHKTKEEKRRVNGGKNRGSNRKKILHLRGHRFFCSDPCAVTFQKANLNGVRFKVVCYIYFRFRVSCIGGIPWVNIQTHPPFLL